MLETVGGWPHNLVIQAHEFVIILAKTDGQNVTSAMAMGMEENILLTLCGLLNSVHCSPRKHQAQHPYPVASSPEHLSAVSPASQLPESALNVILLKQSSYVTRN